jgi:hypothetical protein
LRSSGAAPALRIASLAFRLAKFAPSSGSPAPSQEFEVGFLIFREDVM